jgi:Short C-terminal domain
MPLMRRRPLLRAAMVGGAGYMAGKHRGEMQGGAEMPAQAAPSPAPAPAAPPPQPTSETDRIEALTKLKGLLDSGVLTQEQFEAERDRLLQS